MKELLLLILFSFIKIPTFLYAHKRQLPDFIVEVFNKHDPLNGRKKNIGKKEKYFLC
jgi:hypothetical protein